MSKKKFRFLAGFMIFTAIAFVAVATMVALDYLYPKETIIESNREDAVDKSGAANSIENEIDAKEKSEELSNKGVDTSPELSDGIDNKENIPAQTEVNILFGGDVLLSSPQLNLYDKNNFLVQAILSEELISEMKHADIMMFNQEFPFSNQGDKMEDKQYTFRTDPKRVNIWNELGVDIVTLANNHILDYGIPALLDTITTLDNAGIKHVGAGKDIEDAKKTEQFMIGDKKIGILGASRVIPVYEWNAFEHKAGLFTTYDPTLLIEEIKKAKVENDIVIVYVHWGIERAKHPEEYQRTLGKQYIDAGADLVVGSHPHVLQGIEYYKNKPIVYSLGNYVFGQSEYTTMLLKAKCNHKNEITMSLIPAHSKNAYTKILPAKQTEDFYDNIEQISINITIDEDGTVKQNMK